MNKRLLLCLMSILMALTLCGCWNYRSLDQVDIVVGIAVDFDKQTNQYKVSYEIADLVGASKDGGIKGRIVESEGKTLFDAARNAKRKEADRLFFGSSHIVIISQELAREIGISHIIEWFLRDGECRETMCVALSQEKTAEEILKSPDRMSGIMSVTLHDIIMEDEKVTASTINIKLYALFDMIKSPRNSAVLPVLHRVKNADQETSAINGTAICKGDKLVGFLTPEESKYALFVDNELKGGILTFSMADTQTDDLSLEIFGNETKKSFTYEQGKVKIRIETDTTVSIAENHSQLDVMDEELVKKIEDAVARMIEKKITDLITKIQGQYNTDIFGFGEMIYKQDLQLWKQLEPSWDTLFPALELEVSSKVHISNSAFIK